LDFEGSCGVDWNETEKKEEFETREKEKER